ncbi:MAG: RDD family protein [Fibrobacter sp.]|nr:RDD family protein [Fibrobacter sp.]
MKWFYIDESITDGDRRQGPFSIEEIQSFVKEGKITGTTLVWHSGEEAWRPWKEAAAEMEQNEANQDKILQETINEILKQQVLTKRYAPFFVRSLAYSVDLIILTIAGFAVMGILCATGLMNFQELLQSMEAFSSAPSFETMNNFFSLPGMDLFTSISFLIQTVYFIVLHALYGATVGKKLFRIHVETGAGNKISWMGAIIRYIASIMSMMLYGLGYLTVLIDPKRRGLHDFIASTCVVYNTPKTLQITEK